jgi:transcriptional antiterminator
MCKKSNKYVDHFDTLVALVSYMALMDHTSRTPSLLSKYLSLKEIEVEFVLKNFKGLFRESISTASNSDEKFYCLQIRYATRHAGDNDDEVETIPLKAEYLNTLLEFVSKMVDIEKTTERQAISNLITLIAAVIAFIASVIAIFVR